MVNSPLRILQANSVDSGGGAAKVAWDLLQIYRQKGYESWLVAGTKLSKDPYVRELDHDPYRKGLPGLSAKMWKPLRKFEPSWAGLRTLHRRWQLALDYRRINNRLLGIEDFEFPGTTHLVDLIPTIPDVVHLHNLHGDYYDLRELPALSRQFPVVLSLHDAWLLSGHCAHSFECERWKIGCGYCPDLTIPPPISRDSTAFNWNRKREIFSLSRLYITSPSRWLMDKVEKSIIAPSVEEARVIPNGIDLSIFRPADKGYARELLNIPMDSKAILFCANGIQKNPFKDYETLRKAVSVLANQLLRQKVLLIILGEGGPQEHFGEAEIRFVAYQKDPKIVASYFQAADIYVHATRADVWPLSITEALACGKPVVASFVGGIPEQIADGETGFLVPAGDARAMAARMEQILIDEELCQRMGRAAADSARLRFDLEQVADDYLNWYASLIGKSESRKKSAGIQKTKEVI